MACALRPKGSKSYAVERGRAINRLLSQHALVWSPAPSFLLFVCDMEAVRRAASGAVDTIRNSPLFRRKFGTYQRPENESEEEEERAISPDKDLTPFVQGVYFQVGAKCMAELPLPLVVSPARMEARLS